MDNAKHTPDLLPCPFCGSAGSMLTNSGGYIECLICNAFGPTVNVSRGSAERYWNTRTTPQNDRMWAMLTAISDHLVWHGCKYHPDDWKDYFMHSLSGARFMPHEEGGMIPIGRRTSKLTKDEHSDLTAIIEAFAANQGIILTEPADER